jgi:hypothetical protein
MRWKPEVAAAVEVGAERSKIMFSEVGLQKTNELGCCGSSISIESSLTVCSKQKPKRVGISRGGKRESMSFMKFCVRPCVAIRKVMVNALRGELSIMINNVITSLTRVALDPMSMKTMEGGEMGPFESNK